MRHYSFDSLRADSIAGATVGLVALSLAMAFGISSGVTPQAGIYTAIIGGVIVSLLGGSSIQIAGPTGAFVVIVAGVIAKHGLSGLLMVTMMAGVCLVILGITGLGRAVQFIPRSIVIGFTNGIAILIASTQLNDFFGLKLTSVPSEFIARTQAYIGNVSRIDVPTVTLAALSLACLIVGPRLTKRLPASILVLVTATTATALFHLPVETIGTRFGGIPSGFPHLEIPAFRADLLLPLLPSALSVAILAALESLLSAVVADSLTGQRHNPNAELVGQGIANVFSPLLGGIPVTGAIARTATNFRSGARTPLSGVVHSLTLLAIILVAAPLARYIPLATLAAVLLVVAYNMGEWNEIGGILRLDWADIAVWLITFALTVLADLTLAVEVGMALASLLYINKVSETTSVSQVSKEYIERGRVHILQDKEIPPYVSIVRIHGPFLFGATEKLATITHNLENLQPIVILRLRNMTAIDATGLHALEVLTDRLSASGRTLLLCGARYQPTQFLKQSGFVARFGEANMLPNIGAALKRAERVYRSVGTVQ